MPRTTGLIALLSIQAAAQAPSVKYLQDNYRNEYDGKTSV